MNRAALLATDLAQLPWQDLQRKYESLEREFASVSLRNVAEHLLKIIDGGERFNYW